MNKTILVKHFIFIYQEKFESDDVNKRYITYLNDKDIERRYKLKNLL